MRYFLMLFSVLGLDLGTKNWVKKNLPLGSRREVVKNCFSLRHIKNSGMAYNSFSGERRMILTMTGGLIAFYGGYFLRILGGKGDRRMAMPLAVTLGGALGNFWERLRRGRVTDFLYFHKKGAPIFNVADVAILGGALWMTLIPFFGKKSSKGGGYQERKDSCRG